MILSAYLLFRGYRTGNAFSKIRSRLSKLAPAYIFWNTVAIPYTVLVTGYRSSGNLIEGILGGVWLTDVQIQFPSMVYF